jgi:predicted naringenin-chalcone synthase
VKVPLLSIGTALPEHGIEQARAAGFVHSISERTDERSRRRIEALFRRSRIDRRHSVLLGAGGDLTEAGAFFARDEGWPGTEARMRIYAAQAPPLAARAARRALEAADLEPDRVTHLVTVSCTGFAAPGVDVELLERLELGRDVARTHVGFMGCHGGLNGLRLARAFAAADPAARVLVCAVELCSLHLAREASEGALVANTLFADGAAAALLGGRERPGGWSLAASGSRLFGDSRDAMIWRVGDHGFRMTLSATVPERIGEELAPFLADWLAQSGLEPGDVRSWAVHPGGPRIVEAVEEALGLPPEAAVVSREVLREHGNMSSPTLLFILDRLRRAGAGRPCVALGFGPGLMVEAALFV